MKATPTGHPPNTYVLDAAERNVYQVQPDGSWRKLPIPADEFKRQMALAHNAGKPDLDPAHPPVPSSLLHGHSRAGGR